MTKLVAPFPVFRAFSSTGEILAGGKLYTYAAGTLTPLATYTDQDGGTPNTNPVILDTTGSANVWLNTAPYKFVLKDANDVVQWTIDDIGAQPPSIVNVINYGAVGDGTTDDQPAFAAAAAAAGSWGSVVVPRPSVSYKLGSNVAASAFWLFMGSATISGSGTLGGLTVAQVDGGSINIGGTTIEITNTGKVGIGTAAPAEKLDLLGNFNFSGGGAVDTDQILWLSGPSQASFDWSVENPGVFTMKAPSGSNSILILPNTEAGIAIGSITDPLGVGNTWQPDVEMIIGDAATLPATGFIPSIYTGWNLCFNDGSKSTPTAPTNAFALGMGHSAIGTGGRDTFFIDKAFSGNFGTVLSIDSNGMVGLGVPPALPSSSGFTDPGLYVQGTGGSTTNPPLIVRDKASGSTSQKTISIRRSVSDSTLGTEVGSISTTNSATAYNTSSDHRLKEDVQIIQGALGKVNSVDACNFKWKISDERADGFIAHEIQEVAPYAVVGVKDGEEMQQLDYSKLVPLLWAAVQELSSEVKLLRERLNV